MSTHLLQAIADDPNLSDELRDALKRADGSHRAKRQFAVTPAQPSAFGHLRFPHGSLGEECEFPDRDACVIDDECDQEPLFDAPSERSMGRA